MQKIAILAGTFNPVHLGHLQIATTALAQFQLQRVLWAPIRYPFHKLQQQQQSPNAPSSLPISFEQRLKMVSLAISNQPSFELCLSRSVDSADSYASYASYAYTSYAIDMLQALQPAYPQSQWYWLIGQDALQSLPRWKGRAELAATCCWLVAPRPPIVQGEQGQVRQPDLAQAQAEADCKQVEQTMLSQAIPIRWQILQMPPAPISSSLVRLRRQQGASIQGLVPDCVERYILAHRLYASCYESL
jgi:nicotinate-nucleotide adenylyltransferase